MRAAIARQPCYLPATATLAVALAVVAGSAVADETSQKPPMAPGDQAIIESDAFGSYFVLKPLKQKYEKLVKRVAELRADIDEAHRDGTILETVTADFPRFVHRDPELAPTLHKLRSSGKKLFLLTNSRWSYTDKMMTYLLGDAMGEYPHWRNYFDVVIAAANKPAFFQ